MKKQNLIWLAVGGLAVYFIFFRNTQAKALPSTPKPTDTSSASPEMKELTNEMLLSEWQTWNCGVKPSFRKPKNYAEMMEELKRRNIKTTCK